MRARLFRPQWVIVRPMIKTSGDAFGDAPIVAPDNRDGSFRIKMQVTDTSGFRLGTGIPGKDTDLKKTAVMRKRDIPPDAPDGWAPKTDDLIVLASGDKLFVGDIQNAYPRKISIGNPDGGWDGYRLILTSRQPSLQAAEQYE